MWVNEVVSHQLWSSHVSNHLDKHPNCVDLYEPLCVSPLCRFCGYWVKVHSSKPLCKLLWSVNLNNVHGWFPGNWGFAPFSAVFRTPAVLAEAARVGSFLPFQVQSLWNANTLPVVNFVTVTTCCTFGRAFLMRCGMFFIPTVCTWLCPTGLLLSFSGARCAPFLWSSCALFLYFQCINSNLFCLLECCCHSGIFLYQVNVLSDCCFMLFSLP